MRIEKINGIEVEFFDGDITELPVARFQVFSKFVLLDSKIGSTLSDIDDHISRLAHYVEKDPKKAIVELQNLRLNLYFVLEGINPKQMAFATLVYKLNGQPQNDLTDEGIRRVWRALNTEISKGWFDRMFLAVKKKWMRI